MRLLTLLIVLALSGCADMQQRAQEFRDKQLADDKALGDRTFKLLTPELIKQCTADIHAYSKNYPLKIVGNFAIAPSAVRFVGKDVYGTFDKRKYERADWTGIFASCEQENIFSVKGIKPCGCAYQFKDEKLVYIRVLHPGSFEKLNHY